MRFLGVFIPPVSAIVGALVWFGSVWHPLPALADEPVAEARQLMQGSTSFGMLAAAAEHCKWDDFSRADIDAAKTMQDAMFTKLKNKFGVSDAGLQRDRDAARQAGDEIDCSDRKTRDSMRHYLNGVEAKGR